MLVGLLVLMHDKVGAINDWQNALGPQVQVHAFYPKSHVPQNPGVMQPLDLNLATQMDAFIVTGAQWIDSPLKTCGITAKLPN
ncbi:hypothetical protein [Lacticaseibacillus manihotivorans]|uniref:hypothetical protein n=1 Tax=Lacticaseibacillus manihotivorans TaxID=88233 RepID=UPI0006CF9596|nr:hypothetical protein [Lacticaseibacillus manihotivorans]